MKRKNYLPDERQKIVDAILNNTTDHQTITSHRFNLVSANLFHFLPKTGFDQHPTVYQEIILHNQLTHYEQRKPDILNSLVVENLSIELLQLIKSSPCIFSSFHFGMYRLMNLFLTKNNIPYTILIPQKSLLKERDIFKSIYGTMYPDRSFDSIRFIELESPSLTLKMLRELKQGRSLFVYFDGYRGSGNIQENKRYNQDGQISFLGKKLLARVGIAYIAQMASVPLITGLSYRKSIDDLRLHFFEPVFPDSSISKEKFARDTTQTLYNRFSSFLTDFPGQWEAWLYLHRSLPHYDLHNDTFNKSKNIIPHLKNFQINHHEFGIFKIDNKAYLFNKRSYTSYPIDNEVFNLLENSITRTINPNQINNPLIHLLIENKVIVPVDAGFS